MPLSILLKWIKYKIHNLFFVTLFQIHSSDTLCRNLCTIFSPIISMRKYIITMLMFLYLRCYVDVFVWTRWTTLSWPWTRSTVLFNHCSVIVITCQQVETGMFYQYKFLFQQPWSRTTLLLHHYSTILLKRCWTISCSSDNVHCLGNNPVTDSDNLWDFYVCKSQ